MIEKTDQEKEDEDDDEDDDDDLFEPKQKADTDEERGGRDKVSITTRASDSSGPSTTRI